MIDTEIQLGPFTGHDFDNGLAHEKRMCDEYYKDLHCLLKSYDLYNHWIIEKVAGTTDKNMEEYIVLSK